jgi:hypothetical protein
MGGLDDAARQIERLLHDPLETAVRGTLEITGVSEPAARGRYQEAIIEGVAVATGASPVTVSLRVVLPVKFWPTVGMRLPARIPPAQPDALEVDWSGIAR